jgi:hypothetical protein
VSRGASGGGFALNRFQNLPATWATQRIIEEPARSRPSPHALRALEGMERARWRGLFLGSWERILASYRIECRDRDPDPSNAEP